MSDTSTGAGARGQGYRVLRRLELTVANRLDGLLHGDHHGLVPGHGWETGDTRPYVPGDDVRRIDWNVSARVPDVHVRETIAERELETWILLDATPRLSFGTAATTKADIALEVAAAVGVLTQRAGNRLGALIGTDARRPLPARGGRGHLFTVLDALSRALATCDRPSVPPVPLAQLIESARRPPRRRGLMVVVSDFLDASPWERPLQALAARHEVIAAHVVDPRELDLPAVGALRLTDVETGRVREVHTSSRNRVRYRQAADEQQRTIDRRISSAGADHLTLRTDRDWVLDIAAHVRSRRTRRR